MFKSKRVLIILNVVLFILLCGAGTFAWFVQILSNDMTTPVVTAEAGGILEISTDDTNFTNEIDLSDETLKADDGTSYYQRHFSKLMMTDITGDGVTFIKPSVNKSENPPVVITTENATNAVANSDYISIPLFLRSTEDTVVYLSPQSDLLTTDAIKEGFSILKPTTYGNRDFSRDCIVGAARVSVIDASTTSGEQKFIWIPHPELYLDTTDGFVMKYDRTAELGDENHLPNYHTYSEKSYVHSYYRSNSSGGGVTLVNEFPANQTVTKITDKEAQVITLEAGVSKKILVNVWIEGTDAETRRALEGGSFKLDLRFIASEN